MISYYTSLRPRLGTWIVSYFAFSLIFDIMSTVIWKWRCLSCRLKFVSSASSYLSVLETTLSGILNNDRTDLYMFPSFAYISSVFNIHNYLYRSQLTLHLVTWCLNLFVSIEHYNRIFWRANRYQCLIPANIIIMIPYK